MKRCLLHLFSGKSTRTKGTAVNCTGFTVSYRRSREIRTNIYYIPVGVKSTAQIFGLFGDQKYSDSAEFGLYTKKAEMLLTRNYTALWFSLHVMRDEIEKQFILARDCASRQRPLPTHLATTREVYQGM